MWELKVGFSRKTINPPIGIGISGYYKTRICDGFLDDLEVNTVAIQKDGSTVLLISVDTLKLKRNTVEDMIKRIHSMCNIPKEAIFISATHTHVGGFVGYIQEDAPKELADIYTEQVICAVQESAKEAIDDVKPAKVGYRVNKIENISFNRRYKMKDGSIMTNPGVGNPNIEGKTGDADNQVTVVRFDRENAETIVIANFACHPDTIGGNKTSAEWPGFFRRTFEKAVENTKCVFFNGAMGDINHIQVKPVSGDMNDMTIDFDEVPRGYGHAKFMGRAVAGAVLQVYDKVEYIDADSVKFVQKTIELPTNKATEKELVEAHRIHELHAQGKDSELPYEGMMLTTVVAEAERMCNLEYGPDAIPMSLTVITVGKIAFVGAAGELFNQIGTEIKKIQGYKAIIPCSLTNGAEGYFPMMDSYIEGGYESRASIYKAGVGELIIIESRKILETL